MSYYIGVDVGTTSARAAVVRADADKSVRIIDSSVTPIKIWNDIVDHFEQSSNDIWQAVVSCVNDVMKKCALKPSQITGVGFDATCSLVVLDKQDQPLSVSPESSKPRNDDR